jgi:hypothetical protein
MRKESDIQGEIITMLRLRFGIVAHQNKGTEQPHGRSSARWDKGGSKGVSDLGATIKPHGTALWIEVKKPGGKPTPEQKDFIAHQKKQGALAFVAWSVDDVIKAIEEWKEEKG